MTDNSQPSPASPQIPHMNNGDDDDEPPAAGAAVVLEADEDSPYGLTLSMAPSSEPTHRAEPAEVAL